MISYAFEILKHYLTLPVLLAALLAGDICALLHRGARLRGKIDRRSVVARSLLCAYLVLMFAVLLFAREQKVTHRFELELFWSYRAIGEGYRYLLYQDIFNEGSFCGKGIYDLKIFQKVLKGTFPENLILSHDLIEGCHIRCGLINDLELFDDNPSN